MSESFLPLIVIFLIYSAIAALGRAAKKGAASQKRAFRAPAAPAAGPADEHPQEAAAPQIREIQPTVTVHEHDDSVYRGSLNAVTGEGYDPCHDGQLAQLTLSESVEQVPVTTPGLTLNWTGSDIVRGVVVSEILKRKRF